MADVDEDAIPRAGQGSEDVDLSDETQDFRFLTSISYESQRSAEEPVLMKPQKRGRIYPQTRREGLRAPWHRTPVKYPRIITTGHAQCSVFPTSARAQRTHYQPLPPRIEHGLRREPQRPALR